MHQLDFKAHQATELSVLMLFLIFFMQQFTNIVAIREFSDLLFYKKARK